MEEASENDKQLEKTRERRDKRTKDLLHRKENQELISQQLRQEKEMEQEIRQQHYKDLVSKDPITKIQRLMDEKKRKTEQDRQER